MSYFKKSHQHKPKKGKGSYDRKDFDPVEYVRETRSDNYKDSCKLEGIEQCPVNTTTVDGATPPKG